MLREEINPNPCTTYRRGHSPHWIQANLAGRAEKRPVLGQLLEVSDDGTIVIEVNGQRQTLWNHTPDRLDRIAKFSGGIVTYQSEFNILWIPHGEGARYAFCVAKEGVDPGPCRFGYGPTN
jgi:hypothetical protein